jgi:D-sedoheptulose 7-phosphate isomerase
MEAQIRDIITESIDVKRALLAAPLSTVQKAIEVIAEALGEGRKLLLFGNGGSASDAQHLAAEFVNRFLKPRPALPAVALTTDGSVLTAVGNDDDFREIFARQIMALGSAGDVAWGISTSGESPNVIRGLEAARSIGLVTIGMTGKLGGSVGNIVDHWIHVDSSKTPRIQEAHITVGHVICELVDELLFPNSQEESA